MTTHEASSSSSFKSELWNYDVFLSFRGVDTRYGFTGHLYAALADRGYRAYIDEDGLERGEEIKEKLFQAIEEARISIIVFSKSYADSSWCLDELVKIMECRYKLRRRVLPIFYHVDPSHVRKQNGDLDQAFKKHEKGIREEKDDKERKDKQERVKQWRKALTEAADLSGRHLRDNEYEATLIREIVGQIIPEWLPSAKELDVPEHLVGINSRIQGITRHLSSGGSNVVMVGIWGMGGLGKTTVAKAIYNKIHHEFQFKSFLDNVSEKDVVLSQKKLVSDILQQQTKPEITSVDDGIREIKKLLHCRRALVIIDNVDKVEQLNAIARKCDWFGLGSRIIITTRDEDVLRQVEVHEMYPLHKMNEEEAMELFRWHAFRKGWPNERYLELSKEVVSYCGGLPLALKVLGCFLFRRDVPEWESQLKKLKTTPEGEIIERLRISYEGLDVEQKAIFLDISCFFIGQDKDYVAKILDGCKFCATIGISVLRERCLITVEDNKLNMHDLLREMAKLIISETSPDDPGKWSRLWNQKEAIDVLRNKSGTEKVEGLALNFSWNEEEEGIEEDEGEEGTEEDEGFDLNFPDFSWNEEEEGIEEDEGEEGTEEDEGFDLNFPDFSWNEEEEGTEEDEGFDLNFHYSNWARSSYMPRLSAFSSLQSSNMSSFSTEAFGNMKKLRLLKLENVQLNGEYKHFPKELVWLCWEGCLLKSIPDDFFDQPRLVILEIKYSKLVQVWEGSKRLENLKILNLSHCSNLKKSPDFSNLLNLEELKLKWCKSLSEIHPSIGHLKKLSLVNIKWCKNLISLPGDFYESKSVQTLVLGECGGFSELPEDLGKMVSLRVLKVSDTGITQVPRSTVRLKNLTHLSIHSTWELVQFPGPLHGLDSLRNLDLSRSLLDDDSFPEGFGSLISLQNLDLSYTFIHTLPSLSGFSNLESLRLNDCRYLSTIYDLPTSLKFLDASNCYCMVTMPNFSEMSNMRKLNVPTLLALTEVPDLDKSLNSMTWIDMRDCLNLTADFKRNVLKGWTSCGYGGIFLSRSFVPDWFEFVNDGNKVSFDIPPSDGRNFEGLTLLLFYCSEPLGKWKDGHPRAIIDINNTKCTKLLRQKRKSCTEFQTCTAEDWVTGVPSKTFYLWQGQISNDKLNLQSGDKVDITFEMPVEPHLDPVTIEGTGVNLVWDKPMKENMHDFDPDGVFLIQRHNQIGDASSSSSSFELDDSDHDQLPPAVFDSDPTIFSILIPMICRILVLMIFSILILVVCF